LESLKLGQIFGIDHGAPIVSVDETIWDEGLWATIAMKLDSLVDRTIVLEMETSLEN